MRNLFVLVSLIFILSISCKPTGDEEIEIQVDTFSYDDLDYPNGEIQIPDSLRLGYIDKFFTPWTSQPDHLLANLEAIPGKDLAYLQKYLDDDEWYGENKKPHKKWQREEIVNNVSTDDFPNFLTKGIIVNHTNVRRIPTNKPGFDVYSKAGEGFPFDYFQETGLWANTPLLSAHITKDKQWCYAITPYYKGWISMQDVAIVDDEFTKQWQTGSYCFPLSDRLSLQSHTSNYAVNAKIGMVIPYKEIPNNNARVTVFYPNADENLNAKIIKTEVDKTSIALDDFAFNEKNLKLLVSNLIGRPYGWGGNLENRDCSSMIRDLLGTYGIWLPRDSKDQVGFGSKYELPDATDEKINLIKEKGIPFLTILRKDGHNMLYVGENSNGEPLILHAIWGLKTTYENEELAKMLHSYPIEGIHEDKNGKLHGRHIIGEAVVTSVNVGKDSGKITSPLIEYIHTMTNILGE